jgi:regulatory protein
MPVITDISSQKRHANYYSIFVDDKFSFSLTDLELSNSRLVIGQNLSPAEVDHWQRTSEASKAYHQAINLLSYRMRTRREMSQRLARKGWEEGIVEIVIERLVSEKLLDDEAFGASWVTSRNLLKPTSKRKLALELRQKGLDSEAVEVALADVSREDQIEAIKTIIAKKQKLARYADQQVLIRYLASQGFSYDLVKTALEQLSAD